MPFKPTTPRKTRDLRRFAFGLVLGALLVVGGWIGVVAGQMGVPSYGSVMTDYFYADKLARAEAIDEPKLVIVAGSTALFGMRSPMLEEAYGRRVVNMGVNAGLLLPTLLAKAKPAIGQGDIVLMPLEYRLFNYDGEVNAVLIDYVLAKPEYLWQLPLDVQARALARATVRRVLLGYRAMPDGANPPDPERVDQWGDMQRTTEAERTEAEFHAVRHHAVETHGADQPANPASWRILSGFQDWVQARGGCVIMVPPAFKAEPSYRNDPVERQFYEDLPQRVEAQGFTYVGDPLALMMPEDRFFNTNYHPVDAARDTYTKQIIRALGGNLRQYCPELETE